MSSKRKSKSEQKSVKQSQNLGVGESKVAKEKAASKIKSRIKKAPRLSSKDNEVPNQRQTESGEFNLRSLEDAQFDEIDAIIDHQQAKESATSRSRESRLKKPQNTSSASKRSMTVLKPKKGPAGTKEQYKVPKSKSSIKPKMAKVPLAVKALKAPLSQQSQRKYKELIEQRSSRSSQGQTMIKLEETETELKSDSASSDSLNDAKKTPAGQRGKKRCPLPQCSQLVPIHCSRCPECKIYEFRINHKPRKIKEQYFGVNIYSNAKVSEINDEINIQMDVIKYYGMQSLKNFKEPTKLTKLHNFGQNEHFNQREQELIMPIGCHDQFQNCQITQQIQSFKYHQKKLSSQNFKLITKLINPEDQQLTQIFPEQKDLAEGWRNTNAEPDLKMKKSGHDEIVLEHGKRFHIDADNNQTLQVFNMKYLDRPTVIIKTQWLYQLNSRYLLTLCKADGREGSDAIYVYALVHHSNKTQPTKCALGEKSFGALNAVSWFVPDGSYVNDFDMIKCFNDNGSQKVLQYFVSAEDGKIKVYGLPGEQSPQPQQLQPLRTLEVGSLGMNLSLVRTDIELVQQELIIKICGSDIAGNIHCWENFEQTEIILNAHIKSISDIQWIQLHPRVLIASCSYDGCIKIWDYKHDNIVPIYEHFSSKKWVYSLHYDPAISALFLNQEGKNCPQKILYFKPYQFDLNSLEDPSQQHHFPVENDKVVLRQYKLYNETILQSCSALANDFIYTVGSNGIIYKLAKRDVCRLIQKQKEKLKGNLAKKLVQITRTENSINLNFGDGITEDLQEKYLYADKDCSITNFCVSPDSCSGPGKLSPEYYLKPRDGERTAYSYSYQQPHYISFSLRGSDKLFVINQQQLSRYQSGKE